MVAFRVRGRVLDAQGRVPVAPPVLTVRAFDQTAVHTATPLGAAVTLLTTGEYTISWDHPGTPPVTLLVQVFDGATVVGRSRLIFGARSEETIDIILGDFAEARTPYVGRTEFERIKAAVDAAIVGSTPASIGARDLEYVAGRANVFPGYVAHYIQAAKLAADNATVAIEAFYGMGRSGLSLDLPTLLGAGPAGWRDALRHAYDARIIPEPTTGTTTAAIDAVVAALNALVIDGALTPVVGGRSMRAILDTAGFSLSLQQTYLERWVARTGTVEQFWSDLEAHPSFGSATVALLQFTMMGAALTLQYVPALAGLQAKRTASEISTIADLAAWSVADWVDFLEDTSSPGGPINAPSDMAGANTAEKVQTYARLLERTVGLAFPTATLARRIATAGTVPNTSGVVAFLDAHPDFDIGGTPLARYLEEFPAADPGEATRRNINAVQRLHHIGPRHARHQTAVKLLQNGYTSARQIALLDRSDFVARMGTAFDGTLEGVTGTNLAAVVHETARLKSAAATTLLSMFGAPFKGTGTAAFKSQVPALGAGAGLLTLEGLFGNLDFCICKHCRSVYSPAAYLVDLFNFLRWSDGETPGQSVLDVLLARRPDLRHLELSCDNTNLVLPYIDLVNEILENEIVAGPPASWYQTTWPAADLAISPEHENPAAYAPLETAVYPWTLPFARYDGELRLWLRHLGVPRHELARVLEPTGAPGAPFLADVAAESLGLTVVLRNIITDTAPARPAADYWGLTDVGEWQAPLESVPELMRRAGLTYDEVEELTHMRFIDPNEGTPATELRIAFDPPGCDLEFAWLRTGATPTGTAGSFTATHASAIHRFVRLLRHVDLRPRELDAVIRDLGGETLSGQPGIDCIRQLAAMQRLRAAFRVEPFELLSWWSNLDTRLYSWDQEACLYDRLFQNRSITSPLDSAFALLTNRSELAGTGALTDAQVPLVLAALRLSDTDFRALVDPDTGYCTAARTLAALSLLHRHASFARAVGLRIPELIAIRRITGLDPFASPEATEAFVERVDEIRGSGFTLEELDYLARHRVDAYGPTAPSDPEIATALTAYVRAVQAAMATLTDPQDSTGAIVRQRLAQIFTSASTVDDTMKILQQSAEFNPAAQEAHIEVNFTAFMTNTAPAVAALAYPGGSLVGDLPARYEYVAGLIREHLQRLARDSILDDTLATALRVPRESAHILAFDLLPGIRSTLLDAGFLATDVDADPITRATHGDQFGVWEHANKAGLLVRKFRIPTDQLMWFFAATSAPQWLDLTDLPLATVDDGVAAVVAGWRRILREMDLRRSFRPEANVHRQIASAGPVTGPGSAMARLAEATGWPQADLDHLAGAGRFALSLADLADETALLRLRDAMIAIGRLGVSAAEAWSWINTGASPVSATAARTAAKGKYGDAAWPAVARPIQATLREQRRDALLAHLVASDARFDSVDDVYAHCLIDAEMSACMMTSRLKQALSSVQLFVQRVLLNLEVDAKLPAAKAQTWKWMKSYRVWEANRKVFLYPENWVEPELRDDKTPFFTQFERDLRSNELDEVSVENAYKKYLLALHSVADLEVAGCHHQRPESGDDNPEDIFHVIGRTRGTPHKYYYRRRINDAYWTPWEEIPLEIEGDHVCPVVHNRRIFLFWATFVEESETPENDDDIPRKYLKVMIQWSDYWNGEWTRQRATRLHKWAKTWSLPDGVPSSAVAMKVSHRGYGLAPDGRLWLELSQVRPAVLLPSDPSDDDYLPTLKPKTASTRIFARYWFDDCTDRLVVVKPDTILRYYTGNELWSPPGTVLDAQAFFRAPPSGEGAFNLHVVAQPSGPPVLEHVCLLGTVRSEYRVVLPHAHVGAQVEASRKPRFFFGDTRHTFYVTQRGEFVPFDPRVPPPTPGSSHVPYDVPPTPPVPNIDPGSVLAPDVALVLDGVSTSRMWAGGTPGYARVAVRSGAARATQLDPVSDGGQDALTAAVHELQGATSPADGTLEISAGRVLERYHFAEFHHPYTCTFIQAVNRWGVDGLLAPPDAAWPLKRQVIFDDKFETTYFPTEYVSTDYPFDAITFRYGEAYSVYNWELFFHAPVLIAKRLTADQRFEDAMRWYHYIFNPTDTSEIAAPARFWNIKPFFVEANDFARDELRVLLGHDGTPAEQATARKIFYDQVKEWIANPFRPHVVARMRPEAYAKSVVMGYLDNLIAWGDSLFRRDTIESINEATQLYILASSILGPRPVQLPEQETDPVTWDDIEDDIDPFSNALVELENFPLVEQFGPGVGDGGAWLANDDLPHAPPPVLGWYFCVPPNDRLFAYWDTVADRLFKIRNCMNIEGTVRQLPLFEPPIDPALLVRAVAAGVDLASAVSDLYAPLPRYRFSVLHQRAMDLCGEVRSLGAALLSALEKRDGEKVALLRSSQEIAVLAAVEDVRKEQLREARANVDALVASRATTEQRRDHYQKLLDDGISDLERSQLTTFEAGAGLQTAGGAVSVVGAFLNLIPDFSTGYRPANITTTLGGRAISGVVTGVGQGITLVGTLLKEVSSIHATQAGWKRRAEEWKFTRDSAIKELAAIDKQIAAANLRVAIAEHELDNHRLQRDNAARTDELLRTKYTNEELYDWMVGQVSELHFRAYQLAFEMAKRAERAYRFELDLQDASFITFGYWDNLKKGLMSGERLQLDLRRMDASYLHENRREYELVKHVPLSSLDPVALLRLQHEGSCFIEIPESVFDLDHPGHYLRRVRSVAITIPAVTGPYVTVAAKLTLLQSSIRTNAVLFGDDTYPRDDSEDVDVRFRDQFDGVSAIATSSGQNDTGMFELNFRDERYLPFEGAGAVSRWRLDLVDEFRQFDYQTISEVVLHVSYTARDGGAALRAQALASLRAQLSAFVSAEAGEGLMRVFSARREFPEQWNQFLFPADDADELRLDLPLGIDRFPYVFRNSVVRVRSVTMVLALAEGVDYGPGSLMLPLDGPEHGTQSFTLNPASFGPQAPSAVHDYGELPERPGAYQIILDVSPPDSQLSGVSPSIVDTSGPLHRLVAANIRDLVLVVHYEVEASP